MPEQNLTSDDRRTDRPSIGAPDAATPGRVAADRERLRTLIRDLAVVRGQVTLSSGAQADHYVDLRRITLHHEASPLVGRIMLDLL